MQKRLRTDNVRKQIINTITDIIPVNGVFSYFFA